MRNKILTIFLLAFVYSPFVLSAQNSVLTGMVIDADTKKPLADVMVSVIAENTGKETVMMTDSKGTFRIPHLEFGVYNVSFSADGYKTFTRNKIHLRLNSTIRLNAVLLPVMKEN